MASRSRSPGRGGVQLERTANERDVRSRSREWGVKSVVLEKDKSGGGGRDVGSGKNPFGRGERDALRSSQDWERTAPAWKRLHESVSPHERWRHEDRGRRGWEDDWQERDERRWPQDVKGAERSRQESKDEARDRSRERDRGDALRSPRERVDSRDKRADAGRREQAARSLPNESPKRAGTLLDKARVGERTHEGRDARRDDRSRRSEERGSQKSERERWSSREARSSRGGKESDSSVPDARKRTSLAEAIRQQMQRRKEGGTKEKSIPKGDRDAKGALEKQTSDAAVGKKTVELAKVPEKIEESVSVAETVVSPKYTNLFNDESQEGAAKSSGVAFTLFGHTVAATNPRLSSLETGSGLSLNLLEQLEGPPPNQGPKDPSNSLPEESVPYFFEQFPTICDPNAAPLTDFLQLADHPPNPRFQQEPAELQLLDIEAPKNTLQGQKLFGQLLSPVGLPGAFQGVSNRAVSAQGSQPRRKETATQTRIEEFLARQLDALEVHPLYRYIYTDMPRFVAEKADWAADFSPCAEGVNTGGSLSAGVNKGGSLSLGVVTSSALDETKKRESDPFWSHSGYTEFREETHSPALRKKLQVGILASQALLAPPQEGGRIALEGREASSAAGTSLEDHNSQSELHTLAVERHQSSQDLPYSERALPGAELSFGRGLQVASRLGEDRRSALERPIELSGCAKRAANGLSDELRGELDRTLKKPRLVAETRLNQEGSRLEPSRLTEVRAVPSGEAQNAHEGAVTGMGEDQRGLNGSGFAQNVGPSLEDTAPSNLERDDRCAQLAAPEPTPSVDRATRVEVEPREARRDKRKCALCGAGPSLMRGEWYCGTCGKKDDACECVKPLRANGGRPPKFSDRYSGPKAVVHRVCAFWTPSVYQPGEAFVRLNKAVKDATGSPLNGKTRAPVRCTLCNQTGATSRCRVETCNSVYHFSCAVSAGCRMHGCLEESSLSIACPDHFHVSHPVKRGQTAPARELPWNAAKQGGGKRLKSSPLGRQAAGGGKKRRGRMPLPARKSMIRVPKGNGANESPTRNLEKSHLQHGGERKRLRTPPFLDDTLAGISAAEGFSTPRGSRELKSLFADVRIEREDRLLIEAEREAARYEREVGKMQRKRVEYLESLSEDASLSDPVQALAPAVFRLLERLQSGEEDLASEPACEEVVIELDSEGAVVDSRDKRETKRGSTEPHSSPESNGAAEKKDGSEKVESAPFRGPYVVKQLKGGARVLKAADTSAKGERPETSAVARGVVSLPEQVIASNDRKRKTTESDAEVLEGRKRIKPEGGTERAKVLEHENGKAGVPQSEAILRREESAERGKGFDLPEPSEVTSSDVASDLGEAEVNAVTDGTKTTVHEGYRIFRVDSKKGGESGAKDVEMNGLCGDKVGSSEETDRSQSAPEANKTFGIAFECNACGSKGGADVMQEHPSLPALLCEGCLATYDSANFSDRCKQGIERHCQLCGQREKERPQCESCCKAACKPCLIRILGVERAREIAAVDVWECFSCDPSQLDSLETQLRKFRRVKKGELTEEERNEGLDAGNPGAQGENADLATAMKSETLQNGTFKNEESKGRAGTIPQKATVLGAVLGPPTAVAKPAGKLKSAIKGAGLRRGLDAKQPAGQASDNVVKGLGTNGFLQSTIVGQDSSDHKVAGTKNDDCVGTLEGVSALETATIEKEKGISTSGGNAGSEKDRGVPKRQETDKSLASSKGTEVDKDADSVPNGAGTEAGEFCCTACGSPKALSNRREHPQLPVMVCDTCLAVYTSADFKQKDEKGWDRYCCLCGRLVEANGRLGCDVCSHVACSDCVWRVLGVDRLNQDLMVWLCFSCDTGQLEDFAKHCKASRIGKEEKVKSEAVLDEHFAKLFCSREDAQQKEAADSEEEEGGKEQPVGHPPTLGGAPPEARLSVPSKQPVDELSEAWGFCQCEVCAERFTGGKRDASSPASRLSPNGSRRPKKNGTRPWAAYSRVGARLMHPDLSGGKERVPIPFTNDVDDDTSPLDMDYITSLRLHPDLLDFHERFEPAGGCSGCCQGDRLNGQQAAYPFQSCVRTVDDPLEPLNKHVQDLELFEGDAIRTRSDDQRFDWQQEQMRGRLFYDENGLLQLPPDSHPTIVECNLRCPCWPDCPNAVLQRGPSVHLEIFKTDNGRGFGVRTREDIQRGRLIGQYVGEVITSEEANKRDSMYLFNMDHHVRGGEHQDEIYVVDGGPASNVIRYINHSCDPNLAIYSVYTDTLHPGKPVLALFAITDIVAGTELAYDYKYGEALQATPGSDEGKIECRCGAAKCQKWLPDPTAAKSEYQD